MPDRIEAGALEAALAAAPRSVPEVIAALRAIEAALPRDDGLARFTTLYLAVTEAVEDAIGRRPGTFADPGFVGRLDVVFAELYLDALRATLREPPDVPRAWAPLLAARSRTDVAPIQFALAGMNAHINRDLPVALVRTFEEVAEAPFGRRHLEDYLEVNHLLVETEARVKADLATGPIARLDRALGEVDDVVAMWKVEGARDAAWTNGRALWKLREPAELADAYLRTLDRTVGFAGRGLLRPARPRASRAAAEIGRRLRPARRRPTR